MTLDVSCPSLPAHEMSDDTDSGVIKRYSGILSVSNKDVTFASAMGDHPPPLIPLEDLSAGESLCPGIIKLSPTLIVKFGKYVSLSEAETMHLVSQKASSVPIPKLRNAYSISGVTYILMDYVEGRVLGDCWDSMKQEEKKSIVTQLRRHVSCWRLIKGSFFGTVDGGPCQERLFGHSYEDTGETYGPYLSRSDFNRGIVQALRSSRPKGVAPDSTLESQIMMSTGDDTVLTHGDLHQRNIVVGCNGEIAAILDWGDSCFTIEEMEYCCTRWGSQNKEWQACIPDFVPEFPNEFGFWNDLNEHMRVYVGI